LKVVCCTLCKTEDNRHKDHNDQVRSFSDLPKDQKEAMLNEYITQIEKLKQLIISNQDQLKKRSQGKKKENVNLHKQKRFLELILDLKQNITQINQDIDSEFDRVSQCLETRRKNLQDDLQQKSKVYLYRITCSHTYTYNFCLFLRCILIVFV